MVGRIVEPVAQVLIGVVFVFAFFRILPLTGFDAIPGDQGDVRVVIATLEHWWNFYQSGRFSRSPPLFHPTPGVLGYTDSLFLFTPFYAVARALGADMFTAFQGTLLVLGAVGYAGCLWLLRGSLRLNPVVAAVGSAVFMFSNAQLLSLNHPQLLTTAFLPYLALLTLAYVRHLDDPPRRRHFIGMALCLLFGLVAFTSFYTAWYFAAFVLVAVLVAAAIAALCRGRPAADAAAMWLRKNAVHLSLMTAVMAMALMPIVVTYLPIVREFGGRSYGEVAEMLPLAVDYLNVSYYNVLWGRLLEKALPWLNDRPKFSELRYALTPILMIAFVVGTAVAAARLIDRSGNPVEAGAREKSQLAVVLGISTLICLALMVRNSEGFSPWSVVHGVVPGASAIRSVFRFNLALALPVVIVVGIFLSGLVAPGQSMLVRMAGYGVLALLLVEQANDHTPNFSKREQRERLARIAAPPAACRSFYLLPEAGRRSDWILQQVDAMVIAASRRIPTMHGFSGWTPAGWDLRDPFAAHYPDAVADWVRRNKLPTDSVCGLLKNTGQWLFGLTPLEQNPAVTPAPQRYPWRG
jgi:hypothetical protein